MIEVQCLQNNNETVRIFGRRNMTVLGKRPEKVLIDQNLTRFVINSRQLYQNDSFSFRITGSWITE